MPAEFSTIQRAPDAATAGAPPWLRWYGKVPARLTYPEVTLYEAAAHTAQCVPDAVAWDFFDPTRLIGIFLHRSTPARMRSLRSG